MTPKTLMEFHDGTKMRVVANKYLAVSPLHLENKHQHRQMPSLIHDGILTNNQVPAVGFHEVVIESPYHNDHMAIHKDNHIMAKDLLKAFWQQGLEHCEYDNIEHTVLQPGQVLRIHILRLLARRWYMSKQNDCKLLLWITSKHIDVVSMNTSWQRS
jgi:hypothetical protein